MAEEEIKQQSEDVSQGLEGLGALDAGSKSLTDALRISFSILKIIMLVLVVLFVTSGIFEVQTGKAALVLRFGKLCPADTDEGYLKDGWHWAWPEPVDEVVIIPVGMVQTLEINSFWYFDGIFAGANSPLNPLRDGYCLTRNESNLADEGSDYNIVHSKWQLTYKIGRPDLFFKNIYYKAPSPGQDFLDVAAETVDPLLESLASDAIVATLVKYSIDEAIVSKADIARDVKKTLEEKLEQIGSGITVVAMEITGKITWPRQVNDAFERSIKASQEGQRRISEARGYADKTLSEAGAANAADAERILEVLKDESTTDDEREEILMQLKGAIQEKLADARAYRMSVVETAKANADYLEKMLPQYQKRPELVLQKIYQDAITEVMDNADEKIFIQPAAAGKKREIRVLINKAPKKQQKAEK